MIKANDLRVGNCIDLKNSGFIHIDTHNIGDIVNNPAIFDPITLTPEIIEKAGLEKSESNTMYNDVKYGVTVYCFANGFEFYLDTWHSGIWIKYLHQLQNLYYLLTGEELEINLSEIEK